MKQYSDSLKDINLKQFKQCLDGDYSTLCNTEKYNEDDLKQAWYSIYDEYNNKIKTKGNNIAFTVQKKLYTLPNKKYIIDVCLFVITELITLNHINFTEIHGFDEFIDIIESYGFKFDKENPIDSLKLIKQQVKNLDIQIKREQKTLEEISKRGGDWSFNQTVLAVKKFMNCWLPDKKIKMDEFVEMLNMMLTPRENGEHTNR